MEETASQFQNIEQNIAISLVGSLVFILVKSQPHPSKFLYGLLRYMILRVLLIFFYFIFTAFAWIRFEIEDDCQQVLQAAGIRARGGVAFGSDPKYVRVILLDIDANFEILVERLASIAWEQPLVTE